MDRSIVLMRYIVFALCDKAKKSGFNAIGPIPADTLFAKAKGGFYDGCVAMYHDQGLIPLKLLHFSDAVNITLGLPFLRTSPDHGTGFDIAGRGLARADSISRSGWGLAERA